MEGQRIDALVIDPKRPNILYAATFDEGIYKSVDYGENWTKLTDELTNASVTTMVIDPVNTDVIYAVISGLVLRSSNGGVSWYEINSDRISIWALALDPTNPAILYSGGGNGVYRLDMITAVAVSEGNAAAPQTFSLSQNYPNPFNPETVIEYQLQGSSSVRLRIYNVMGQEVRTLVNEKKPAGAYRVRWDGRDDGGKVVPAGVYFYRLEVGGAARGGRSNFVQTRKMILLK
ncbi:MAG: T9SS type A sorting domain-containing protein [Calditrichaeota bacterium]|nr:T9SS type A sorting domain-containing protein [Calditrichota bacterium]